MFSFQMSNVHFYFPLSKAPFLPQPQGEQGRKVLLVPLAPLPKSCRTFALRNPSKAAEKVMAKPNHCRVTLKPLPLLLHCWFGFSTLHLCSKNTWRKFPRETSGQRGSVLEISTKNQHHCRVCERRQKLHFISLSPFSLCRGSLIKQW